MFVAQQEHGGNDSDRQCYKGFAKESQNRLNTGQCGNNLCHGIGNDENQRNQDNANDRPELGQLAFINIFLIGNGFRNRDKIFVAADLTPDRAGHDHGKNTAEDTDEDDPAKVNAQHSSYQHGAGCRRNERMADGQTSQERDGVEQSGTLCALCQREGQRDQNDKTCIEEHRHGNDKTGNTQCPRGFFIAEFAHHRDRQRLRTAGDFKDRTEHGT